MIDTLKEHLVAVENFSSQSPEEIENFRIKYLGKKGLMNEFFAAFKTIPNDQKKEFGQVINQLKKAATEKVNALKEALEDQQDTAGVYGDLTRPGQPLELGARHPISIVKNQIIDIFSRIGFNVSEGPEVEDDWHNFTALNLPEYHPARDMQDTFFIQTNPDILLRTHTSSVQVRYMENNKPPIRTISPGRVYRNEAISARSHCFFHQVEGLMVDRNVSFAHLRGILHDFLHHFFEESLEVRFRPSYFPFTEPSAEVDVMGKNGQWLEVLGCGMVHPNVLKAVNIDPEEYTGFAFGMGVERLTMLRYGVNDLRAFFENDLRFLKQFN